MSTVRTILSHPSRITIALGLLASALSVSGVQAQDKAIIAKPRPELVRLYQPMPAATNVKATPYPNRVSVRWTCPTGATSFEVFATPAGGQQMNVSGPIAAQCVQDLQLSPPNTGRLPGLSTSPPAPTYSTGFQHNGLRPGQEISYVVRSLYPNGIGDASPVVVTTPPWPAPTGVQVRIEAAPAPSRDRLVVVSWTAVQGAPGYEVWATSLYEGQPNIRLTQSLVTGNTYTLASGIGLKGIFVKTVDGLASLPVDIPW